MIDFSSAKKVYVAMHKVDFRKSYDGLLAEAYRMGLDPIAGDLIMFISRCKRKIKILFCDANGIWVLAKRFHKGGYKRKWSFLDKPSQKEVTQSELMMLINGMEFNVTHKIKPWPEIA